MRPILLLGIAGFALGQGLPDGPGKAATERMCKACHGLENVVRTKRTKDKWADVVDDMIARGAKGTDTEVDQVIDYLAFHFGPSVKVNVNTANSADLAANLGIAPADAEAIVRYRSNSGSFKSVADLAKVSGIDAKKIESIQDRIEF